MTQQELAQLKNDYKREIEKVSHAYVGFLIDMCMCLRLLLFFIFTIIIVIIFIVLI